MMLIRLYYITSLAMTNFHWYTGKNSTKLIIETAHRTELVDGTQLLRQSSDITPMLYLTFTPKKDFIKQSKSLSHCNNSIPHAVVKGS